MKTLPSLIVLVAFVLASCAPTIPYRNGPQMDQKGIREVFRPLLEFMNYKPGMRVADVGAGSGALTVMMATLMDSSDVYIQDIDTSVLEQNNVDKMIDYYSKQSRKDLRAANRFHLVIGNMEHTNLPDGTLDLVYSNATIHNFVSIDSMVTDIGRKLAPGGVVYFRDSFKGDHGEGERCSDPKCGRPLLTIDEFLQIMDRNHFALVKRAPDMSGYPVFGFARKN